MLRASWVGRRAPTGGTSTTTATSSLTATVQNQARAAATLACETYNSRTTSAPSLSEDLGLASGSRRPQRGAGRCTVATTGDRPDAVRRVSRDEHHTGPRSTRISRPPTDRSDVRRLDLVSASWCCSRLHRPAPFVSRTPGLPGYDHLGLWRWRDRLPRPDMDDLDGAQRNGVGSSLPERLHSELRPRHLLPLRSLFDRHDRGRLDQRAGLLGRQRQLPERRTEWEGERNLHIAHPSAPHAYLLGQPVARIGNFPCSVRTVLRAICRFHECQFSGLSHGRISRLRIGGQRRDLDPERRPRLSVGRRWLLSHRSCLPEPSGAQRHGLLRLRMAVDPSTWPDVPRVHRRTGYAAQRLWPSDPARPYSRLR